MGSFTYQTDLPAAQGLAPEIASLPSSLSSILTVERWKITIRHIDAGG